MSDNEDLDNDYEFVVCKMREYASEIDDLHRNRDLLLSLISRMRGQWIHTVHEQDCRKALIGSEYHQP